ncbi:alpha/beta fold hydrolase [Pendulispora brunnea]|uniref:Alpha/beta fold hydrolase n=1 Tax=Pendulispora brunnea TaxID=2905690 RepID=A0ABZ2KJX4_9BACT
MNGTTKSNNAILMIHGLCCGAEVWDRMAGAFRQLGWRVEAPTLSPHLRVKDAPSDELAKMSLKDYVDEMEGAARRLEADTGHRPIVVGHSLGGLIAQKLAERGAARAAVFMTPLAPAGVPPKLSLAPFVTLGNILFSRNLEKRPVKIWETGFKWGMLNGVPASRHKEIYATMRYCSGMVFRDLIMPDKNPERVAYVDETRINVPTLTIGAVKDRTVPVATHRLVAEKYKRVGGDYLEYSDRAHWVLDDLGTDRTVADITNWLESKQLGLA